MKKLGYILILLLTLPLVGLAQNDSLINNENPKPILKDQLNLDVNLLGLGLTFNKPINDAFTFGVRGGFIYNYFIVQTGQRDYAAAYAESIGFMFGITYNHIKRLSFIGELKVALPYTFADIANFQSPFIGISFLVFYEISPNLSLGTNIDFGAIKLENKFISTISTSFITLRIKVGK